MHRPNFKTLRVYIENFITFAKFSSDVSALYRKAHYQEQGLSERNYLRQALIDEIGKAALVKLAVASTFIRDLTYGPTNWGIANHQLMVVDADCSYRKLVDYLKDAKEMPHKIAWDFSLDDVREMQIIYQNMLEKPAPKVHPAADMPQEMYQTLVLSYLRACENCIIKIQKRYPMRMPNKPSHKINDMLARAMGKELLAYENNAETMVRPGL